GGGDDLAVVAVHDRHDFAAAAGEDAVMGGIDGDAGGVLAGGERPAVENLQRMRINVEQLALVLEHVEDVAAAVTGGKLGTAAEVNGAGRDPGGGIDRDRLVGVAAEGENAVGGRVIDDAVHVLGGGNLLDRLQGVDVKFGDGL